MLPSQLPLAAPEEVGFSSAALARLGRALNAEIQRGRLPGAVALIARRGKIAYFENFGRRDPAGAAPMEKDTIFRIYSMTKPMTSVAAMMLWEEGRILLTDPIANYLPEFAKPQVSVERNGKIETVPASRPISIHDLLRHTSGLTYEFMGSAAVHKMYMAAKIYRRDQSSADQVTALSGMPLVHQPGAVWEYSRSTDVLGRLIEVVSESTLGAFFKSRIFEPLGMTDTGFHVPPQDLPRLAEAFREDPDTGGAVQLMNATSAPRFESGGGGLVSTASDYARFLQMLLSWGKFGATRLLSRKTVEFMTADHLGQVTGAPELLPPGYGFGLGFAVRLATGIAHMPGSAGEYFWGGLAGTTFWVDPAEELFAVMLIQAPGRRDYYRTLFRDLVYAAVDD